MSHIAIRRLTVVSALSVFIPHFAIAEIKWDQAACAYFHYVRAADICTLMAVGDYAVLPNEPAQLIAEQAVKKCSGFWSRVYDHDYPPNVRAASDRFAASFDSFMKSWAEDFTLPLVLESRMPSGSNKPETDLEHRTTKMYADKLRTDCGELR